MRYRKRRDKYIEKKNSWKFVRTLLEIIFCLAAVATLIVVAFFPNRYSEPDRTKWGQCEGFVVLSYPGISYGPSEKLVSKGELDSHLKALRDSGYVSIGIQDVIDYYNSGGPLPEKALLLMFEDGRRDSFIFAQPILEKYNFKAVMFTYASNVQGKDMLFLKARDLKYLDKSSYWEIASNGYRFSYINVYGETSADSKDHWGEGEVVFTHYLMDYLRDKDGIPMESKRQMQQRITEDYRDMNRVYTDILGYQPRAYMIMHANTLFHDMNESVEEINLQNIYRYFKIMFNRNGSCYNTREDSIYDLTRLQVKSGWTVDKLLAEIDKTIGGR